MKKIINYSCYVIVIFIGIFNLCYGINYEIKQYEFLKEAEKTTANIYQTTNREDGKQVLHINFYVKNKKYDGVLVLKEKTISKSTLTIYYDKNNPVKFTNGEIDNSGYFIIILGIILILLGIIFLFRVILRKELTMQRNEKLNNSIRNGMIK